MLKLTCSFKRLRQLGLQIWRLTKVRTRAAGRVGDFGNFLIVLSNLSCKIVKNCRIIGLNRARKNKFCSRSV